MATPCNTFSHMSGSLRAEGGGRRVNSGESRVEDIGTGGEGLQYCRVSVSGSNGNLTTRVAELLYKVECSARNILTFELWDGAVGEATKGRRRVEESR